MTSSGVDGTRRCSAAPLTAHARRQAGSGGMNSAACWPEGQFARFNTYSELTCSHFVTFVTFCSLVHLKCVYKVLFYSKLTRSLNTTNL